MTELKGEILVMTIEVKVMIIEKKVRRVEFGVFHLLSRKDDINF